MWKPLSVKRLKILIIFIIFFTASCEKKRAYSLLTIDFPILKLDFDYRPESIEYSHEMDLLNAMYSKIFHYDDSGFIKTNTLKNFYWEKGIFTLSFKENLKTSKGVTWGAEDAFLSIKRLLILDKNTHGKLKSFLCPKENLLTLADNCSGLSRLDNKILFKIKKGQMKILIELMTTGEMSIIPKGLINKQTLKISDYSETTGHYYLEKINRNEKSATLKINKFHPSKQKGEKAIKLIGHYDYSSRPEEDLSKTDTQVCPTFSFVDHGTAYKHGKEKGYTIHASLPISLHYIRFSPKSNIPRSRRFSIYKKIKETAAYIFEQSLFDSIN